MSEPFIGEIRIFPYNFVPEGWLLCNGQTYPVNQFQALFSLLGYTFGGDRSTLFAVPNFLPAGPGTNLVPIGAGQGPGLTPRQLGQSGGSNQVSILQQQMPSHQHTVSAANFDGELSTPQDNFLSSEPQNLLYKPVTSSDSVVSLAGSALLPTTGGSLPHENRQPLLTLGFCIAYDGVYPTRP